MNKNLIIVIILIISLIVIIGIIGTIVYVAGNSSEKVCFTGIRCYYKIDNNNFSEYLYYTIDKEADTPRLLVANIEKIRMDSIIYYKITQFNGSIIWINSINYLVIEEISTSIS